MPGINLQPHVLVARENSSFFSNYFEKEMEKAMLTARDVLEQLFLTFLGLILVKKRVKRYMHIVVQVSVL